MWLQRGGDRLGAHHPPGGIVSVCEHAIGEQIAAVIPGVGDGVPRRRGDQETVGRIIRVRGDGSSDKRRGQGIGTRLPTGSYW